MNYLALKNLLLQFPTSSETFPFDATTAVFKVNNKMFALVSKENDPLRINLKCDPNEAQLLRDMFESVIPGYHMNKEHWNTLILDGKIEFPLIHKMIYDSYSLVIVKFNKSERTALLKKLNAMK
jgi:predicted DNA-binding protein (MmcQ/YjbR family)